MNSKPIKLVSTVLLLLRPAHAATHAVLPGESIQAKVDLAAPGDIVAIFGGTYAQDVSVNKAIRLVEVDDQDVTITGNVTFTGVTNAPPFEGFTVGSAGKGITVSDTTGIVFKDVDARPGSGIVVNGASKASISGGFYSQISQDGGELTSTRTQVLGAFNTTINSQKTIEFRTNVQGIQNWNSKKAWIGYSTGTLFSFGGVNSKVVIVGCTFNGGGGYSGILAFGGNLNNFSLTNSNIVGLTYGEHWVNSATTYYGGSCVSIGEGNRAFVANNHFSAVNNTSHWQNFYGAPTTQGCGIYSASLSCTSINNIFNGCWRGLNIPYGAISSNNHFYQVYQNEIGGVVSFNSSAGDPLFVSGSEPALQVSSPCVNTGLSDPVYNDRDNTRNDIGPSGGTLYDPDGWTTNSPVVISFDLAPQQLLKGVDTQVTLSNGRAVSQP